MRKIYFNQCCLNISSDIIKNSLPIQLDYSSNDILREYLQKLESGEHESLALISSNEEAMFDRISSFYTPISAAGGLIENNQGEFLFIFRREKWDLPKGKMDEGETALETAIREIEEETGVKGLAFFSALPDSYHVYEAFGKKWLKTTHWFHFKTAFAGPLIPQTEEDINAIKWIWPTDLEIVKKNTYPAILEILSAAFPGNDTI